MITSDYFAVLVFDTKRIRKIEEAGFAIRSIFLSRHSLEKLEMDYVLELYRLDQRSVCVVTPVGCIDYRNWTFLD